MTKQEIINTLNSSLLEDDDKKVFFDIIENESEIISKEAEAKITDALQNLVEDIASKTGTPIVQTSEIEEIDIKFKKEIDDAEKLLSKLDMTERDLDIAYNSVKK